MNTMPAMTMYHFMLMRREADSGAMGNRSRNEAARKFRGSERRRNTQRFDTSLRGNAQELRREHRFDLRRLGKNAAGFGHEKRIVFEVKGGNHAGGELGKSFPGVGEDFLRNNVAGKRGFGDQGKERGKNAVGMLGDAAENHLPIMSPLCDKDFFAENGSGADSVASAKSGFNRAAADIVSTAIVSQPWAPSARANRFPRGVATAGG